MPGPGARGERVSLALSTLKKLNSPLKYTNNMLHLTLTLHLFIPHIKRARAETKLHIRWTDMKLVLVSKTVNNSNNIYNNILITGIPIVLCTETYVLLHTHKCNNNQATHSVTVSDFTAKPTHISL